jgi:predicted nucleic acid-binding protein
MTDAFDSDVLIYAAEPGHVLGQRVAALFAHSSPETPAGIGSLLLLPEVLSRPMRGGKAEERDRLDAFLACLDLHPVDAVIAQLATEFGATYRLRAVDAVHLATAVNAGADRFVTNNRRDFPATIEEIDIVYPDQLPD